MSASVAPEKNKLSRRKKARAKKTLNKAFVRVMSEIENDQFLRSHLFLNKPEKNKLVIGGYVVVKNENELYDVYKKKSNNLLYENLYCFDAAMAIVESFNAGYPKRVEEILDLERDYMNNRNDMKIFKYHYELSLKGEERNNAWIYEDRYLIATNRARIALEEIKRFRIAGR